jgi:hypothetical protein
MLNLGMYETMQWAILPYPLTLKLTVSAVERKLIEEGSAVILL